MERVSFSEQQTREIAAEFGKKLKPGSLVSLFGELGAGKSTFVKGIAAACGVNPLEVSSPTFVYLNQYLGHLPLYHFDLYRLEGEKQFLEMGFDEYLFSDGIVCMEWSERITSILPQKRWEVYLTHEGEGRRKIVIQEHIG